MQGRRWVGVCWVGDVWMVGDGLACAGWETGRHVYGRRWVGLCRVGDGCVGAG